MTEIISFTISECKQVFYQQRVVKEHFVLWRSFPKKADGTDGHYENSYLEYRNIYPIKLRDLVFEPNCFRMTEEQFQEVFDIPKYTREEPIVIGKVVDF